MHYNADIVYPVPHPQGVGNHLFPVDNETQLYQFY